MPIRGLTERKRLGFALRYTLFLAAIACAPGGCGSVTAVNNDSGAGGSGTPDAALDVVLNVTQACTQLAEAACDAITTCAEFTVRILYGDRSTCVSRWLLGCTGDQGVPEISRTVADIAACARAIGTATCPDLLASRFPEVCRIKPGLRVNGTACGSNWQCQSTYCRKSGPCGICGPRADVGGACTVDAGCAEGMVCVAMKCTIPGTQCSPAAAPALACRSDLYCTSPTIGGECVPRVGAGVSCANNSDACDLAQGVACNPFNMICETVGVAKGGEACGLINGGLTVCSGLNPCPGALVGGVCANPAADGAACGTGANGTNCVAPAECIMQICRLPSAASCG